MMEDAAGVFNVYLIIYICLVPHQVTKRKAESVLSFV